MRSNERQLNGPLQGESNEWFSECFGPGSPGAAGLAFRRSEDHGVCGYGGLHGVQGIARGSASVRDSAGTGRGARPRGRIQDALGGAGAVGFLGSGGALFPFRPGRSDANDQLHEEPFHRGRSAGPCADWRDVSRHGYPHGCRPLLKRLLGAGRAATATGAVVTAQSATAAGPPNSPVARASSSRIVAPLVHKCHAAQKPVGASNSSAHRKDSWPAPKEAANQSLSQPMICGASTRLATLAMKSKMAQAVARMLAGTTF